MPAYYEGALVDTTSIEYSKTGIRLLRFIKTVFEHDVLEKLMTGKLIVWFNAKPVEFDKKFRDHRVKKNTNVEVKGNTIQLEVDESNFA